MIRRMPRTALAAFLLLLAGLPASAADVGSACAFEQAEADLPFTRAIGASGVVSHSLAESTALAGVPPAAMDEALKAFSTFVDLDRDVQDGDRFYVRYEQMFTLDGARTGAGKVLWAELQLATGKRTVGVYRFRPKKGVEQFWTGNAQGTGTPQIRLPLDTIVVSSGFGVRVDPFDQPAVRGMGMGPARAPNPPTPSPLLQSVNTATPLGQSLGLAPNAYAGIMGNMKSRATSHGIGMAMHEGVDLVAPPGTPIHAAGDGIVIGAEPKGRYGNWVEIEHPNKLATVYGHLSAFAPGIGPGAEVHQGDVIGYVGTTGRTTGPHVHFELLVNGRPTNAIVHPAVRRSFLIGPDLVAFRREVANDQAERQREEKLR